jgi:hypothetical protein
LARFPLILGYLFMPSPTHPGAASCSSEQAPSSAGTGTLGGWQDAARLGVLSGRRLGEVCPEVMLIMPFAVPLLLAMWLRKWLRRRVGRKAGNVIGKAAIIAFGGPPLLVAFVAVLLMRLALAVLERLDRAARAWRRA